SPTDNHVLDATHDVDIALAVHGCEISGMQPAKSINRLGGLVGHIVVPFHHVEAADQEFATLTKTNRLSCRRIDDFCLHMRVRSARCCRLQRKAIPISGHGPATSNFSKTEVNAAIGPHLLFDLFHQDYRNGRSPCEYLLERRESEFASQE